MEDAQGAGHDAQGAGHQESASPAEVRPDQPPPLTPARPLVVAPTNGCHTNGCNTDGCHMVLGRAAADSDTDAASERQRSLGVSRDGDEDGTCSATAI